MDSVGEYLEKKGGNALKKYLESLDSCHFPHLLDGIEGQKQRCSIAIPFENESLAVHAFCARNGVKLPDLLKTVWALVLRNYIGTDQVCFGYSTLEMRDEDCHVPVGGPERLLTVMSKGSNGAGISASICSAHLERSTSLGAIIESIGANSLPSGKLQNYSLSDVQLVLDLLGEPLFNTEMTMCSANRGKAEKSTLLLESFIRENRSKVSQSNIYDHLIQWR
jgi:hypothetical protein